MGDILTIIHSCKDFASWRIAFDADGRNRAAAALTDLLLLRDSADPNRICLVFAVGNRASVEAMTSSSELRMTMQQAGIVGAPEMRFFSGEFSPGEGKNYLTLHTAVSSMETFRQGYAMDAADRRNASLTDLALLQDIDDPHSLLLIWSVGDVDRATAFLHSPELAEHQVNNAGLVGKPVAHFWTR